MIKNRDGSFSKDRSEQESQIVAKAMKECNGNWFELEALNYIKSKDIPCFSTIIDQGVIYRHRQVELGVDRDFKKFVITEKHGLSLKEFYD
jgi:hypothetical protein